MGLSTLMKYQELIPNSAAIPDAGDLCRQGFLAVFIAGAAKAEARSRTAVAFDGKPVETIGQSMTMPCGTLTSLRPVAIISGPHVVSQTCQFTLSARQSRDVTRQRRSVSGDHSFRLLQSVKFNEPQKHVDMD